MERRRYLAVMVGMGMLAGCNEEDDPEAAAPDDTPEPTPSPTDTATQTEDPLEHTEIDVEGFRYPNEATGYDGDHPGVVAEETVSVEVIVDVPVAADGEFDAELKLTVEDADGAVIAAADQRVNGSTSSSSDGTIQLLREFTFDAAAFDYAQYQFVADAADQQTETADSGRESVELLYSNWKVRADVRGHMKAAKDILADAIEIYHDIGDGDWLDVTAETGSTGAVNKVRSRTFDAKGRSTDARDAAINSSLDYYGTWEARIDRIDAEVELIRSFCDAQIGLFDAHDDAIETFDAYEQEDRNNYFVPPSIELEADIRDFEAWRDPVADYRSKLGQMEADADVLGSIEQAADDTQTGLRRYEIAQDYYDDERYTDAENAAMNAIDNYDAALDEISDVEVFSDLRWSCRRSVQSLRDAAEELRDDAREQQG